MKAHKCLLIFTLMEKNLNKEAFKASMTKVWNLEGSIVFHEVGHHKYLIEFQKSVDIDRVLKGRPWSFDKHLICIQLLDNSNPPNEDMFTYEPFWIQLYGLPYAAMTTEGGENWKINRGNS